MSTIKDVAEWMRDEFDQWGELSQGETAREIIDRFGDQFVSETERGGYSINKDVRDEFDKLTGGGAVWEGGSKKWRKRTNWDGPGRLGR